MDKYRPLADINFKAFEDSEELPGLKKVTLPEVTHKVVTMTGAGFMGSVDVALAGMIESMGLGLDFSSAASTARLMAPKEHRVTVYSAAQIWNVPKAMQETKKVKYVFVLAPKGTKPGDLAPMNQSNASGTYSVYYYAAYENGEQLWVTWPAANVDLACGQCQMTPMNQIFKVKGEDYFADIRKAMGE